MESDPDHLDIARPAVRLALAVSRIKARSREQAGVPRPGLPLSQWSLLVRLIGSGPATASELSASEHVSQQAIGQSVAALRSAGLLEVRADPADRRKHRLAVTREGCRLVDAVARDSWLSRAIDATVGPEEADTLDAAIDLLERLAATNPDPTPSRRRRTT